MDPSTSASLSRTLYQAMIPSTILMLTLIIFTGFVIPFDYMLPWCRWISYLNPVFYGLESLMVNEFHNRNYPCAEYIPDYPAVGAENSVCSAIGAAPGQLFVNGDVYIGLTFSYHHSHKWRNVGIIIAMMIFNHAVHFASTEWITAKKSKGEVLVFLRGFIPYTAKKGGDDIEMYSGGGSSSPAIDRPNDGILSRSDNKGNIERSTSVFHWRNLCYDLMVKKERRRILDNVDGWVKPGTLTALMGVSGAGKTTLLDCLADRTNIGVISGEMLVDGKIRD